MGLVPPYILKFNAITEPYPAIILPAGAGKINISKSTLSFRQSMLWGKREFDSPEWAALDVEKLLYPIPTHYFVPIFSRSLRLGKGAEHIVQSISQNDNAKGKGLDQNLKITNNWISGKLKQQGFQPNTIRLTVEDVTLDTFSQKRTSSIIKHEKIFELY